MDPCRVFFWPPDIDPNVVTGAIDPKHCMLKGSGVGPLAVPNKQITSVVVQTVDGSGLFARFFLLAKASRQCLLAFGNERRTGGQAEFTLEARGINNKTGNSWEKSLLLDVPLLASSISISKGRSHELTIDKRHQ